ncbi:MAG: ATP-binding protein, partial [Gammaproteobacteria bacterium]
MSTPGAKPVLVAWSGGKDAACALERLRVDPAWRVAGIVTTVTQGYERIAIHGVRRALLEKQAARLDLPLYEAQIPPQASNE